MAANRNSDQDETAASSSSLCILKGNHGNVANLNGAPLVGVYKQTPTQSSDEREQQLAHLRV
eukprot:765463-Hanusia_phi.AAC.2